MADRRNSSHTRASRSSTRRSQDQSRSREESVERSPRREESTSVSHRHRHHRNKDPTGSLLEDRVRRMEETQNRILQLLEETRRPIQEPTRRNHPSPGPATARGIPVEEHHPRRIHPQEGPQHHDVEILDTASSAHPSQKGQPAGNSPALDGNSPQPHPANLHQQAMRDELRRLVREEFPSKIRDTHASHGFREATPFAGTISQCPVPTGFKLPSMDSYEGLSDPYEHIDHYRTVMNIQRATDAVLCQVFPATLKGQARSWFYSLPRESVHNFDELARLFTEQFIANRRIIKDSSHLSGIRQNEGESLRDYFQRFSSEARQIPGVDPELLRGVLLGGLRPGPFYSALMRETVHSYADLVHRIEAQISADDAINAHRQQFEHSSGKRKSASEGSGKPAQRQRPDQRKNQDLPQRTSLPQHNFQPAKSFTPLNTSRTNILMSIQGEGNVKWPQPLKSGTGDQTKYCHFHRSNGHNTENCRTLQEEIERLIAQGYLAQYVKNHPHRQTPAPAGGQQNNHQIIGEID